MVWGETMINQKNMMYQHPQKGATLIVVLFLLLIIMVVGTFAIKMGVTSLGISTNAQINQLLSQSADTPLNKYLNTANLNNLVSYTSAVGAALDETGPNREFIFCYRPTNSRAFGLNSDSSVISAKASGDDAQLVNSGVAGFCNIERDFGSARQAVVTQVAITIPKYKDETKKPGDGLVRGTDLSSGTGLPKKLVYQDTIRVTTTAFLPAYANTSLNTVQRNCLSSNKTYISDNLSEELTTKKTLKECLSDYNIPVVSQVQEFTLAAYIDQTEAP